MTDKYEPISLIGKGNFGSITKIRRKSDGKILVWKELNYGSMKEKYKHHITSEINILKELHHPNIVKYYDRIIDKENTKIYIIMEYCPGGDLSQLIKRCRHQKQYISEDIIWKIFSQVVSALYACHTNKSGKILHRDIKPSNIFLDNENNVKLGDFGLSLMLNNEMNFAYSNVGTPYYMSPEQVDENKYNEKSDIWSLGCFLYELTALHPPFEAHNHLSLALKIKSGKVDKLPEKYSENLCKVIFWMMNVDQNKRPSIKDIILVPDVNIRIKERKIKEGYQKLKKFENELKVKEENLIENEKKLKIKEKYLDEREKNIIQRENYIKMKEEEMKYNNKDGIDNNKYKNYNSLFITSGGFDIKGLDNLNETYNNKNNNLKYDSELNTIKNGPISNKKYYNRPNMTTMNEILPVNIDKKYSNTIRKSNNEEIIQFDYENNNNLNKKENNSLYSNKLKTNIDTNINNNSLKNLLTNHYNTSKNNYINSINFNNSNNSLTKINSNKNIVDSHSKVISFNSELNYSSNDEKVIKNNNINTSNINSLGFLSINSQENNIMGNNNSNNNINGSIRNNSIYNYRHSNNKNNPFKEYNKNSSYADNNMDYKSGSTNYFSSIPRTSGESYNENMNNEGIKNNETNMNINYNSFNIRNSQGSENKNNYKENYRLQRNENNRDSKKSKQTLNIEYNKKYDSEQNIYEYSKNDIKKNNKNYHNRYIPNNFRNNSYGKKTKFNDDQNNSENSLNIKIRHQNNNIPRKKYTSSHSTNSINIINFNNVSNKGDKLSPESCRLEDNYILNLKKENISRNRQGRIEGKIDGKYYKNEYIYEDTNYYKPKNKGKNINYNNNIYSSDKEILSTKNKNYNEENIDMKRRKLESNSNRYINTINNKENNYFHF